MHRPDTRSRLLKAAERVFAREGIEAATTRAIARQARVNEVTLFRHFGSKENLLSAVVRRSFPAKAAPSLPPPASGDLRADLEAFARRYEEQLQANFALVRTLIGEIHRHRQHSHRVLQGIFEPLRAALVARLEQAAAAGEIRSGTRPEIAADVFHGAISGVLRRACAVKPRAYAPGEYLRACVETFGLALTAPAK